jgi:protein O-mannosyl-transferase
MPRARRVVPTGGSQRRRLLMPVGLALAGSLAYLNSLRRPFLFDDIAAIVDNAQIRRLADLRVFLPERESPVAGRPLVNLSLAINYALGGLNVVGYHIWNVALHLLCGLLLFALVRDALGLPHVPSALGSRAALIGFVAALLWILHPLNTEVVTYVTQRTESMMAAFYLLTLYASWRAR